MKAEAEERSDGGGGGTNDEDESTDEDFNPDQQESDVAEEYVFFRFNKNIKIPSNRFKCNYFHSSLIILYN